MSEKKGKSMPMEVAAKLSARQCVGVMVERMPKNARDFCSRVIVRLESLLPPDRPPVTRPVSEVLQHYSVGKSCVGRIIRQFLVRHRGLHIQSAQLGHYENMGMQEAAIDRWLGIMEREGLWHDCKLWRDADGAHSSIAAHNVGNHSPSGIEWGFGGSGPLSLAADVLIEFGINEDELRDVFAGMYSALCDDLISLIPHRPSVGMCVVCGFNTYGRWSFRECPPHGERHAAYIYIPMQSVLEWINAWRLREAG